MSNLVRSPSTRLSKSGKLSLPGDVEWRPNPGPQERFLACPAFEVCYGGAAGGGKSAAILMGATRYIHIPQYRALILRRTIPELKRSLIPRSQEVYRGLGGVYLSTDKVWTFPSGAVIQFGSIEHSDDALKFKSDEYQYIGWDELTSFEEQQYTFMFSRLRSAHGIPLRVRAATNPGDVGHEWVLKRFAPWLYPEAEGEYKGVRAASGERLYYTRDERTGLEKWCDKGTPNAKARAFFKAFLSDNPHLAGTGYDLSLDELDPVTRAQQKFGNWMARSAKGAYFKRGWFELVDVAPARVVARVRYWDRAATPDGGDWTAGVLLSRTHDGLWFIEHVVRGQWSPKLVEETIRLTTDLDPPNTRVVLEQDPAAAGKFEKEYYLRALVGFDVHVVAPQGDKITRAKPVSAQAEARNFRILRGPWVELLLRELEAFPEGHDDQIDALSGAFRQCLVVNTVQASVGGTRTMSSSTTTQRTKF
jgi:predicted phage terminase large subunit-like protein